MKLISLSYTKIRYFLREGLNPKKIILCSMLCAFCTLFSCIDEKIIEPSQKTESTESNDDDALTFYLDAGDGFSTRYDTQTDVESYDNTIISLRMLFFDLEGRFLFESPNDENHMSLERVYDENNVEKIRYKVTAKLGDIKDGNGNSIANDIRLQLVNNDFKVAFLINWPNNNPTWTYNNSYLNKDNKVIDVTNLKTLDDLHFLKNTDSAYGSSTLSFLTKDGKMSENQDWVESRSLVSEYHVDKAGHEKPSDSFNLDKNSAASWIRTFWDPETDKKFIDGTSSTGVYIYYAGLWKLWNFGGAFEGTKLSYQDLEAQDWEVEWKQRNGYDFNEPRPDDGGDGKWLGIWGNAWFTETVTCDGLTLVPSSAEAKNENKEKIIRSYNKNNYHGIILPPVESLEPYNGNTYVGNSTKAYLTFTQETTGHLKIYYSAYGGASKDDENESAVSSSASLRLMKGRSDIKVISTNKVPSLDGLEVWSDEVKITGDPEDIYIFTDAASDNSVIIYAIEFISDTYLYETNRQGVSPKKQKIAMFGVQQYEALHTWSNGETKDLFEEGGRDVSIIRSVAKVVVYLPKKAKQIFMRSINRKSNCEPVDVNTSTSITWKDDHVTECEWNNIKAYDNWIVGGDADIYKNWMKWYYGTWKNIMNWDDNDVPTETDKGNYPHLYNAHITRSDFCEFIYGGVQNGRYKYVLYVPEKGVADPNNAGYFRKSGSKSDESPKVIHIEYRYDNSSNNLDDNKCYRIYFTDYSDESNPINAVASSDKYDDYEGNLDNLEYNWPIMRNHIYRFYVRESNGANLTETIKVRIDPWGYNPKETWEEVW